MDIISQRSFNESLKEVCDHKRLSARYGSNPSTLELEVGRSEMSSICCTVIAHGGFFVCYFLFVFFSYLFCFQQFKYTETSKIIRSTLKYLGYILCFIHNYNLLSGFFFHIYQKFHYFFIFLHQHFDYKEMLTF